MAYFSTADNHFAGLSLFRGLKPIRPELGKNSEKYWMRLLDSFFTKKKKERKEIPQSNCTIKEKVGLPMIIIYLAFI